MPDTSIEITKSLEETYARAGALVKRELLGKKRTHATVVALFGDLGSGKTSFTQGVARALGVTETVISPTFVIERVYKIEKPPFTHFIHIDCYRLSNSAELRALGWNDVVKNKSNIIFVEWAERVEDVLPDDAIRIQLEFIDEYARKIKILNSNGS